MLPHRENGHQRRTSRLAPLLTPPKPPRFYADDSSAKRNPIQSNRTLPNSGEVTLEDFIAFAQKKTWGQDESTDPFNALLAATANEAMLSNAAAAGAGRGEIGAALGDECSDSDGEDARCG